MLKKVILLALPAGLLAAQAWGAELPDGLYDCTMGSMHLGEMKIAGDRYTEPALGGGGKVQYPFELTDAGVISWDGPMGGMSTGGNTVVSTEIKRDGDNAGYDVMVQLENGHMHTVSCSRE